MQKKKVNGHFGDFISQPCLTTHCCLFNVQAEAIGKAVQDYMESLNMDRVYDYMYHLISEYAKLLDFKPVRPSTALEECVDSLLCYADETHRGFLKRSTASPSQTPPCKLPPSNVEIINKHMDAKNIMINKTLN